MAKNLFLAYREFPAQPYSWTWPPKPLVRRPNIIGNLAHLGTNSAFPVKVGKMPLMLYKPLRITCSTGQSPARIANAWIPLHQKLIRRNIPQPYCRWSIRMSSLLRRFSLSRLLLPDVNIAPSPSKLTSFISVQLSRSPFFGTHFRESLRTVFRRISMWPGALGL